MMKESKFDTLGLLYAVGIFGLVIYLFFPTLKDIALICWEDDDYSHGLILPIVAIYMIWDRKSQILSRIQEAHARGKDSATVLPLLVLIAGLVVFFVGEASQISFTSWFAFFPVIFACLFLTFGKATAYSLVFPIGLLFMAKPLPDSLVVRLFWPLQVFAAQVSTETLKLFKVPVYLSGNIIEIPAMKLLVEEACSGMRSVMAMLTLALIVVYFIELRLMSKIMLALSAVFVAVVLNVFRVASTGLLAHFYDPETATGFFHTFSGLIVFVIGLPILYMIGLGFTKLEQRGAKS
jgi:exosortase